MSNLTYAELERQLNETKLQLSIAQGLVSDARHIVTRFRAVLGGLRYKDDAEGQFFRQRNEAMATRCDAFIIAATQPTLQHKEEMRRLREQLEQAQGYKVGDVHPSADLIYCQCEFCQAGMPRRCLMVRK